MRTFVQICTKGQPCGNWKKNQKYCSNQTMVGCDELTLNSIQVAVKIIFVVCLHISETMSFVCVITISNWLATPALFH